MNLKFIEQVPHRTPETHFDKFISYIKDKKVVDLGCGSGDSMLYMKYKLGCKEIYGVDNTNRPDKNVEKYKLKIYKNNILNVDFTGSDTYYIWIERPNIEAEVVYRLKKYCKNYIFDIKYL